MSIEPQAMIPPPVAILQMLTGKWISQAISVAAELKVADHLESGAKTPEQLASIAQAHPQALYRLLRGLASVGVFAEDGEGRFANTPLSDALRTNANGSMRSMALFYGDHPTWDAWGELGYSVRTGKSAFEKVHGSLPFEYWPKHPHANRYFDEAMTGFSEQEIEAIHRAVDFSSARTLVDVAGGHGALLTSTLKKNPSQQGILFDQPQVIAGAKPVVGASGVAGRCELVAGDFFKEVPGGADAYMMKHILHDWNDERATAILETIHRAAKPGAKLFVIDAVIQPGNEPGFAKLMDLEMLVLYNGGRERTEREFKGLLSAAGFEIVRVVPTDSPASVIEAVRK